MKHAYTDTIICNPDKLCWSTAARILHWLIAISLVGSAGYTEQGDTWHSELGWLALGLLLIQIIYNYSGKTSWALWFVTAIMTAINLSGWITPDHSSHFLVTFSGVILAAFYFATVIFESVSLLISRFSNHVNAM